MPLGEDFHQLTDTWVARARRSPRQSEVGAGLTMVAIYFALHTLALPDPAQPVWLVVAAALTLVSPLGGLTILAAIGAFTQALTAAGQITVVPYLLAVLGASVLVRVVVTRPLPRPNLPIVLAVLLMAGTALGVLNSYLAYGADRGVMAIQMWVPGIGGALTVLIAAAWVAWRGSVVPLAVAVTSTAAAGVLALVNLAAHDYLRQSTAIGWLLRQEESGSQRLTGVVITPNPAAVIFLLGLAGCVAVALLVPRRLWLRLLMLPVAALLLYAIWLTGSRSGLLSAVVAVSLIVFVWNRRIGVAAAAVLIGSVVFLIAVGGVRAFATDQLRVDAWLAGIRLWVEHPLLGAGFRSFEWLNATIGSPLINAPHNEWLRFFAEEGTLVGLIGLAFALLTPIAVLRTRGWAAATSGAVAAAVFVAACFNNIFIYTQVNVASFAIIGTGLGLAIRQRAADEPNVRAHLSEVRGPAEPAPRPRAP